MCNFRNIFLYIGEDRCFKCRKCTLACPTKVVSYE
ncbi:4Fe-4S binding protein [Xylanibacter brevis]